MFLAHYLANNTFPGATPLEYAFIGGLSISPALVISPLATICTRKYGTRATLFVGVVLETAGLLGAAFTNAIWQLFLTQAVGFGLGMGFLVRTPTELLAPMLLWRRACIYSLILSLSITIPNPLD